jgi:hypothetical protein
MNVRRGNRNKEDFIGFLKSVVNGTADMGRWNECAVNHYLEAEIEEARIELVRASISDTEQSPVHSEAVAETAKRLLNWLEGA